MDCLCTFGKKKICNIILFIWILCLILAVGYFYRLTSAEKFLEQIDSCTEYQIKKYEILLSDDERFLLSAASYYYKRENYCKTYFYLLKMQQKWINSKVELTMAEVCSKMRNKEKARFHFERSIGINPGKLNSRYRYFLWLKEFGKEKQIIQQAICIDTMPSKVVSPLEIAIKMEVKSYLNDSAEADNK